MAQTQSRFALRLPKRKRVDDAAIPSPELIEVRLKGRALDEAGEVESSRAEWNGVRPNGHGEVAWPMEQELRAAGNDAATSIDPRPSAGEAVVTDEPEAGEVMIADEPTASDEMIGDEPEAGEVMIADEPTASDEMIGDELAAGGVMIGDEAADPAVDSEVDAPSEQLAADPPSPTTFAAPRVGRPSGAMPGGSAFVEGMVRAMRAAAETERERSLASLKEAAEAAVVEAGEKATEQAAELRRLAEEEVTSIRERSKEEINRLKEETNARLAARRERLTAELEDLTASSGRAAERIQVAVEAYEQQLESLFERIRSEDDPTAIAGLVATVPNLPDLSDVAWAEDADESARAEVVAARLAIELPPSWYSTLDAELEESASAGEKIRDEEAEEGTLADVPVEAEADAQVEPVTESEPMEAVAPETEPATSEATEAMLPVETGAESEGYLVGAVEEAPPEEAEAAPAEAVVQAPEEAVAPAAEEVAVETTVEQAAEAPPEAPETSHERVLTTVYVRGLSGIAAIAGYKWQLVAVDGVESAQVSSGEDGELVIRVEHAADLRLPSALEQLSGYATRVERSEGSEIWATARETG